MRIDYTGLIIDGPTNSPQPFPSNKTTNLDPFTGNAPRDFKINTIYPNPFNGSTVIDFKVEYLSRVEMKIYNIHGKPVHSLKKGLLNKGNYHARWDGTDKNGQSTPSGTYFCTLSSNGKVRDSQKIIYIK